MVINVRIAAVSALNCGVGSYSSTLVDFLHAAKQATKATSRKMYLNFTIIRKNKLLIRMLQFLTYFNISSFGKLSLYRDSLGLLNKKGLRYRP